MKKAQGGVVGTVILTTIVLLVISTTYLWGRPIIQKNIDQARMSTVLQNMKDLDNAIKYTASTGSNTVLEINLDNSALIINEEDNYVMYETKTTIPLVASTEQVPLNYYELARKRRSITYNTTWTTNTDPQLTGYEQITHHTNTTINNTFYNVSVHENSTSTYYDLLCIWMNNIVKESDCAKEGGAIFKENTPHDVMSILADGTAAYALGEEIENKGVLGSEPSGIISGRTISAGEEQTVEIYLTYRTLISEDNQEYKTILTCTDCAAGGGDTIIRITRENIIRTPNGVNTIIKIGME